MPRRSTERGKQLIYRVMFGSLAPHSSGVNGSDSFDSGSVIEKGRARVDRLLRIGMPERDVSVIGAVVLVDLGDATANSRPTFPEGNDDQS